MNDISSGSGRDPVDELLESFLGRLRRGERPSLEEYVARCPDRAAEIRELFPALIEMEWLKPAVAAGTGPHERPSARPDPTIRPPPPHPERLGDYHILRVIGEGGMGVVYEAEHESLSNRVALKVMHPRFRTGGSHLRRFRQEARSAARLHHTNIVPVFAFGEQDGICYYAMQYIAGHSLDTVLDDIRRLRREDEGPAATPDTVPHVEEDVRRPAVRNDRDEAGHRSTDALRRTATLGLLTGRYAEATPAEDSEAGSSSILGATSPPAEGMAREADRIAAAAANLALGMDTTIAVEEGQTQRVPGPLSNVEDPAPAGSTAAYHPPDAPAALAPAGSSSGSSVSTLTGQADDRYYREVARLIAQVADALEYAHRQGVVHRDIKPSNLLLDAQGNVWVTDFGLAKLIEGDDLSQSREIVGTLRFMAPERFRGVTDRRSDIYAVGATLYEMLALRPAFDGRDQIQLIDKITHQPPAPLRQHDRRIPRDLETLALRAMAKDPEERFATTSELRDELRRFLEGRPIRSRPVPAYEQFWRWCKRNRMLATASITAAVLIVFVAVTAPIAAWMYRFQLKTLEIEQGRTKANLDRAVNAERQGRLDLGKSYLSEGAALQRTGLIGQRFGSLEQLSKAAPLLREHPDGRALLPELRDQAITAMGLTDLRLIQRRDIGPMMGVACDPALERYATIELLAKGSSGGLTVVRSMADDREVFRVPRPGLDFWWGGIEFSPDGCYLMVIYVLTGGEQHCALWHLGRKELAFRQRCYGLTFHPDGRRLIFRPTEKEVVVWDLVEGREIKRLPIDLVPAVVCFDSDGRRIAVNASSGPRKLEIIELETGRVVATWTENVGNGGGMSWSRDGHLLATGNGDGRVFVRDVERGSLASVLHEHMWGAGGCVFAPKCYLLLTTSFSGSAQVWDASSGRLLVTAPVTRDARFSTDGRRMAIHDGSNLDIWEIAHEQELITLNPGLIGNRTANESRGSIVAARFSPDSRMIAVATAEATHLYDGHDGRELGKLETGHCETLLFDREGRNLITNGNRGLFRWPIRDDPVSGPGAFEIGPPVLIRDKSSTSLDKATWLPDGRTLPMIEYRDSRVLLLDADDPHAARKRARALSTPWRSRMKSIAVCPDGRWAAAGGWNDQGVYVWDLPRRRFERVLPRGDTVADGHTLPAFSPDGRWLVVNSEVGAASGYYFWQVGTWKRGPYIPRPTSAGWGEPVFSADGAMIALAVAANQVRLYEMATGRTIAHLTTLQALAPTPLAFNPDGTRLIASTTRQTALIWELRRIRERLRTMDLDWDQPPYPAEEASPGAARPPIRSIRVLGAALEPAARRAGELAACEARLRDHPDDIEALLDRGWLKLKMSKPAEAIPDVERGLRFRPDDADALYLLAEAQIATNDRAAARATLEKYLAHAGDDTDAHALKGRLALQLGRLQEADDDHSRVLDLDPARVRVRFERAQIRLRLGRLEDALADLDALVARFAHNAEFLGLRSQVHERLGHREQALADLKRAAELPEPPAQLYNNLAWTLATGPAALRDPQQAVALAHKAIASSPDTAVYLNTLGVAQYRAGQFAEAITTLEKSLAASKGESDAFDLFFLAMARHRLGRVAQARADFDRAVTWRRDHPNLAQPGWPEELDAFHAEARDVLYGPPPELPADVFAPSSGP